MKRNTSPLVSLAIASVLAGGCAKEPDAPPAGKEQTANQTKSADPKATVAATLTAYEDIRAKLAADDIAGATAQADALASAATKAASEAPEALRDKLSSTARAAEALSKAPADDPDAVRKAFGEVSRFVVALLATDASVREGTYVFECPMAQGYQKWVQRTDAIENPYMGKRMLACGSKATWEG